MRTVILALILLVTTLALPARAGAAWQPASTYALLIGILEWQDPSLSSFPKTNRQDRALERALVANGVPAGHVVFLEDRQATLASIRGALGRLMAQAGPGSTLLVYFAGHGTQEGGRTYLANYDVDTKRLAATGLAVDDLGKRLAAGWHGERLLLLADCCHSGALASVVNQMGTAGRPAACLTSATATNTSTGRWTFTEAVVRALTGDGQLDRNGDGRLSFAEVDAHVHDEMKFGEDQLTAGVRAGSFAADWTLRGVAAPPKQPFGAQRDRWSVGGYVEGLAEGKWWRARVLEAADHRCRLHYVGWADSYDEWVGDDRLRPIAGSRFAAGQRVEVTWEDTWYPARILRSAEGYFHFVHYADYGPEWDEWVTDSRIRPAGR